MSEGLDILVDLNPFAVEYRYGSLGSDDEATPRYWSLVRSPTSGDVAGHG